MGKESDAPDIETDDERYYREVATRTPHWVRADRRKPPSQDPVLNAHWACDVGLVLGAQNPGGGGGGGFDPRSSDAKIAGKLVLNDEGSKHRGDDPERYPSDEFKLVGRKLIASLAESSKCPSPMTRIARAEERLKRVRSYHREILWLAYGPVIYLLETKQRLGDFPAVCLLTGECISGFNAYRDQQFEISLDMKVSHMARLRAEQFIASSKEDQAEMSARGKWLLTKASSVAVARVKLESIRMVHAAWNSWMDTATTNQERRASSHAKIERHSSESDAAEALEEKL